LREILPNAIIGVDGGINETNIKSMPLAGVGYVVVGSALVGGGNIADNYARLQEALNSEITDYSS
jgi:pentose-5-phosphate-3-epimerase